MSNSSSRSNGARSRSTLPPVRESEESWDLPVVRPAHSSRKNAKARSASARAPFVGGTPKKPNKPRHAPTTPSSLNPNYIPSHSPLYRSAIDQQGNAVHTNEKEVSYTATQFFDYVGTTAAPVQQVFIDPDAGFYFGGNTTDLNGQTFTRVLSVKAYVLPRASNAAVANTSFVCATSVPVVSTDPLSTVQTRSTMSNRNTIIKPTFNVRWIKVLDYKVNELFKSALIGPLRLPSSTDAAVQALFSISCLDPDDLSVFSDVQVMYTVRFAKPLIPVQTITRGFLSIANWNTVVEETVPLAQDFAMVGINGVSKHY